MIIKFFYVNSIGMILEQFQSYSWMRYIIYQRFRFCNIGFHDVVVMATRQLLRDGWFESHPRYFVFLTYYKYACWLSKQLIFSRTTFYIIHEFCFACPIMKFYNHANDKLDSLLYLEQCSKLSLNLVYSCLT